MGRCSRWYENGWAVGFYRVKVLIFHPVLLPPQGYGGVERVVQWLAKGLIERGHEVTLGVLEGSRVPDGAEMLEFAPSEVSAEVLVSRLPAGIEMVHFMAPPESGVMNQLSCNSILTVHGNGKPGETFPENSVFISQDHARRHAASTYIYNGIDPDEYVFEPNQKENWHLFLSKTTWSVKNLTGAIEYCAIAGSPLKVAGGKRPLSSRLKSLFDPRMRKLIQWEGTVNGMRKAKLLAHAKSLVFPVKWPEPFGLVVAEALMSGTPVIASRRGSLPELVNQDVGAVLNGQDNDEWIRLLSSEKLPWKPEMCRQWALKNFHYRKMAESYETLYKRVAGGETLHTRKPVAGDWRKE